MNDQTQSKQAEPTKNAEATDAEATDAKIAKDGKTMDEEDNSSVPQSPSFSSSDEEEVPLKPKRLVKKGSIENNSGSKEKKSGTQEDNSGTQEDNSGPKLEIPVYDPNRFSFRSRKNHRYYNKNLQDLPQEATAPSERKKRELPTRRNRGQKTTEELDEPETKEATTKKKKKRKKESIESAGAPEDKPPALPPPPAPPREAAVLPAATSGKKPALSRPTKIAQVKGPTACRKFELVARRMKEFQLSVTWEEEYDQKSKPKLQASMMVYDEMIDDPQHAIKDRYFREKPQLSFLVPEDFVPAHFGALLERVGKQMKKGAREGPGWKIVNNIKELHHRVYGDKRSFRPNGNGAGNQQAGKNNGFLGPGYECVKPKKKPKKPKKSTAENEVEAVVVDKKLPVDVVAYPASPDKEMKEDIQQMYM